MAVTIATLGQSPLQSMGVWTHMAVLLAGTAAGQDGSGEQPHHQSLPWLGRLAIEVGFYLPVQRALNHDLTEVLVVSSLIFPSAPMPPENRRIALSPLVGVPNLAGPNFWGTVNSAWGLLAPNDKPPAPPEPSTCRFMTAIWSWSGAGAVVGGLLEPGISSAGARDRLSPA